MEGGEGMAAMGISACSRKHGRRRKRGFLRLIPFEADKSVSKSERAYLRGEENGVVTWEKGQEITFDFLREKKRGGSTRTWWVGGGGDI